MWRRLIAIVLLGLVALILAERYGAGGRQRRGMRAAEAFRQQIQQTVTADARFAEVEMAVVTHPSLRVYGTVPDAKALQDLEAVCKAPPDAPFFVFFHVKLRPETTTTTTRPAP